MRTVILYRLALSPPWTRHISLWKRELKEMDSTRAVTQRVKSQRCTEKLSRSVYYFTGQETEAQEGMEGLSEDTELIQTEAKTRNQGS